MLSIIIGAIYAHLGLIYVHVRDVNVRVINESIEWLILWY